MLKKLSLISLFLFTSCGQNDISSIKKNQDEKIISERNDSSDKNENKEDEESKDEKDKEDEKDGIAKAIEGSYQNEINDLKDKVAKLNEEVKKKEIEIENLKAGNNAGMNNFFVEFFQNVLQKEYPFKCAGVRSFSSTQWFEKFKNEFEKNNFKYNKTKNKILVNDFAVVCSSTDNSNKVAVFLGAKNDADDEFIMVKYNINLNVIARTVIGNGNCEDCPISFGERKNSYIEMNGEKGKVYRYYFDKNILMEEKFF